MRTTTVTLALFIALAGFAAEDGLAAGPGDTEQSVIGGVPSTGFPATCLMNVALPPDEDGVPQDPIVCSCSLVGEGVVLTAARCVEQNTPAADADPADADALLAAIEVRFGDSGTEAIPVDEVVLYRYFDSDDAASDDIALLNLASSPAGVEPVTLRSEALTAEDVGAEIQLVGYGVNQAGDAGSTGALRAATTTIRTINEDHILAGEDEITTCAGDSGGPVFMGGEQIAMTAYQTSCNTIVRRLRIDHYAEEFIEAYLQKDQGCVDCEPCDWNGECVDDCPTRDWDCPLGSFVGAACELSGDCEEGGRCVPAADDETFTFCSRPCDPTAATAACPSGMECSDLGSGAGECVWLAPSPGSQGFSCADDSQCRSGICEDTICVFPCEAGACDAPYVCGPSKVADGVDVCLGQDLSGGGGFCAVSPAGSNAGGHRGAFFFTLLSVLGMALILRRR